MTDLGKKEDAMIATSIGGLKSFQEFKLHPEVLSSIEEMGFKTPSPVQAMTYEKIIEGADAIIMAQTGTGKTAAFGIPIVQKVDPKKDTVQALILVPTRELALQVSREVSLIGKKKDLSCVPVYGGASFTKQMEEINQGAKMIAGTPGRVLDHMRRGTIPFKDLSILVLDEADEMLSMGFEKEISEILNGLPTERQTLLFSATIPDDIQRLAGRYMDSAVTISVSGDAVGATEISHFIYLCSGNERVADLVKIIDVEQPESAIIFCNTRDETQMTARYLKQAGYNAEWINSDLSQNERERVMNDTRKGKIKYLVATDVAARGIDISHLSHVINFSFPESLEVYVHRTGRTGRQGRHGAAVSLITPQDIGNLYMLRLTYKIYPVERTLPGSEIDVKKNEIRRLNALREAVSGLSVEEMSLSMARRLMQDIDGERLIAGLFHLFQSGEGSDKGTAQVTKGTQFKKQFGGSKNRASKSSKTRDSRRDEQGTSGTSRPSRAPQKKADTDNTKASKQISAEQSKVHDNVFASAGRPVQGNERVPEEKKRGNEAVDSNFSGQEITVEKTTTKNDSQHFRTSFESNEASKHSASGNSKSDGGTAGMNGQSAQEMSDIGFGFETENAVDVPSGNQQIGNSATSQNRRFQSDVPGVPSDIVEKVRKSQPPKRISIIPNMEREMPVFDSDGDITELYIDAGRKDGLKISSLMKDVVETTGLPRSSVGKVRMLTRSTFIAVATESAETVLEALKTIEVGGRLLKVERAEE